MVTNKLIPRYPPKVVGLKQTTFTSHHKWVLTHRTSGISLHHLLDLFPPHRIPTESQRDTPPSFPGNSYRCTVSLPIHHSDRISLLFITDSCRFFFYVFVKSVVFRTTAESRVSNGWLERERCDLLQLFFPEIRKTRQRNCVVFWLGSQSCVKPWMARDKFSTTINSKWMV